MGFAESQKNNTIDFIENLCYISHDIVVVGIQIYIIQLLLSVLYIAGTNWQLLMVENCSVFLSVRHYIY